MSAVNVGSCAGSDRVGQDLAGLAVPPNHDLPAQPGRRERTAWLSFRFGAVALRRPATADKGLAASVDLFVVDVTEVDAPPDVEKLPRSSLHAWSAAANA
jgi:hypothetical protein